MKQTSIEWLINQITYSKELYDNEGNASAEAMAKVIEQASEMHKKEILDAFNEGMVNSVDWFNDGKTDEAKDYYEGTYGGDK